MDEASLKSLNLVFRFVLEMLVLVALFAFGLGLSDEALIAIPLALLTPALVMVVWGLFVAPKASRRLRDPARLALELVIWFVGVIAFGFAIGWIVAILFGLAVLISLALMFYWGQRGA